MTSGRRGALAGTLAALLVAVTAACGSDPTELEFEVVDQVTYASAFITENGSDTFTVNLGLMSQTGTTPSVWYQDLVVGTGDTAVIGDTMFVRYNGWLRDGTPFDATGRDFSFIFLDGRTAIGGFHWGTEGMQEGGERLLLIPPDWAYGSASVGPIYPGAVLVFTVVLDSIHAGP